MRTPNPYIVGNPVRDASMFFGREAEFELVRKRFQHSARGGLLVFCGERRSGKTSILFQIVDGRLGPGFLPILVDMQSMAIETESDFLVRIAAEIGVALVREGSETAPPVFEPGSKPAAGFRSFVEQLALRHPDRRPVFLVDEYELLESKIDSGTLSEDVLHIFSWLMENLPVFFVFTGSQPVEERRRDYWNILGKSIYRTISYLHRDDAVKLITRPVEGQVDYAGGVVDSICRLTAGQPFYTQAVCQMLVDHLNEAGTRAATMEIVSEVAESLVENPLPQMIFRWDGLERDQKIVLALLAESLADESAWAGAREAMQTFARGKYPIELHASRVAVALESLFQRELLLKNDESPPGYAYRMDLWRRWIRRMHSLWQVIREQSLPAARPASRLRRRIVAAAGATAALAALLYWGLPALVHLELVEYMPPGDPLTLGQSSTAAFYAGDLDPLWARFGETLKLKAKSPDGLRSFREQIEQQLGKETGVLDEAVTDFGDLHVYTRRARFSRITDVVDIVWAFGERGIIESFSIQPGQTAAARAASLAMGQGLTASFYQGSIEDLWARFGDAMRNLMGSPDGLREFKEGIDRTMGRETHLLSEYVTRLSGLQLYTRRAQFSRTSRVIDVVWAYDEEGAIQGFTIQPGRTEAGRGPFLTLWVQPADAGRIFLDGEPSGTGFLRTAVAPSREHAVRVAAAGYADTTFTVRIEPQDSLVARISLRPLRGALRVETRPPAAEVVVDRVPRGTSPVTVAELAAPVEHRVSVALRGYETVEREVRVPPDSTLTLVLELPVGRSAVLVSSAPPGAAVSIDGVPRGVTPVTVRDLTHAPHAIRLTLDNYAPADTTVPVDAQTQQVHVVLRPGPPARLVIQGDHPARIYIDGVLVVENVQYSGERRLSAGRHAIQVILVSGDTVTDSLDLASGELVTYDYSRAGVISRRRGEP